MSSNTAASWGTMTLWSRRTEPRSGGKPRPTWSCMATPLIGSTVRELSASGAARGRPAVLPGSGELRLGACEQAVDLPRLRRIAEEQPRGFGVAVAQRDDQ